MSYINGESIAKVFTILLVISTVLLTFIVITAKIGIEMFTHADLIETKTPIKCDTTVTIKNGKADTLYIYHLPK